MEMVNVIFFFINTKTADIYTLSLHDALPIFTCNGYVEVTASETDKYRMFGLSHADVNQSYNTIQFGLYLANNGRLEVWESGSPRGGVGTYAAGDKLRVSVDSGVVTYRKNETTVLYTSMLTPTYPLFVDTALFTNGATINNAVISGSGGCGNQPPTANPGGPYNGTPGVP